MKHFIPSATIASAGRIVEDAAVIKPVRPVRWEVSRTVPVAVRNARVEAENEAARVEIRGIVEAARGPKRGRAVILG